MPQQLKRRSLKQRCPAGYTRKYSGGRKLGVCKKRSGGKRKSGPKKRKTPKRKSAPRKRKSAPRKRASGKRKSAYTRKSPRPVKRHSPFRSYRIGRPSPNYSATTFPRGTVRVGGDGNLWKIAIASNGVRRWQRLR